MILTDREIQFALAAHQLVIDPLPASGCYTSTSVDLTLAPALRVFRRSDTGGLRTHVDVGASDFDIHKVIEAIAESRTIDPTCGFQLDPNVMVLGWTAERVELDYRMRVAARVEGKSSLARLGLAVHVTAPTIHAGFEGQIQLEMVNYGPVPLVLRPGIRICQLIFEQTLGVPEKGYDGRFRGQRA